MATKKHAPDSIEVEIFGSTYTLRGGSDPAAVRALARSLDARMQTLAGSAPGADPVKVAILTALRIADEATDAREDTSARDDDISARLDRCASRLATALEPVIGHIAPGDEPAAAE